MKLLFSVLMLVGCFLSCRNDLTKEEGQREFPKDQIFIRQDLYDFIKSRTYVLSSDTIPAKDIHIEFVLTSKKDTIFLLSSYYAASLIENNDDYKGYIDVGEFKLFIFDKDNIAKQYYNNDLLVTLPVEIERTSDAVLVAIGLIENDAFFEIYDTFFDENMINLFKCYNTPSIR